MLAHHTARASRMACHVVAARRDALAVTVASTTDHRGLAALSEQLAVTQAEVEAAEERWLELAAAAEDLGLDV